LVTDAKHLPGFDERWVEPRGVPIRYFAAGRGRPVVLLHGLGGAAANWSAVAPQLARSRRVLVPELPGHGGSAPLAALPTLEPFVDVVLEVARAEDALPTAIVGHSLGGLVALMVAGRAPEAVTAVVVAAGAGISSGARAAEAVLTVLGLVQPGRVVARYRRRWASSPLLRTLAFGWWGISDPVGLSPETAESFLVGPGWHTDTFAAGKALVHTDPRPDLARVRCPCLCLWGADDHWVPLQDGMEYARRLHAPLRVVADCGHLLIGERPDACVEAIEDFLDGAGL
jgi:pimeloyl-ACP methyl ester carboxylesterase